jgi:anti-anti-sigma factor
MPPATFGGELLAMSAQFSCTVHNLPGLCIAEVSGELDLATTDGLTDALVDAAAGLTLVVVDLSGLTFMDSSGIGALLAARNRVLANGGLLVLSRPRAIVRKALEIVGLDSWIEEWSADWGPRYDPRGITQLETQAASRVPS